MNNLGTSYSDLSGADSNWTRYGDHNTQHITANLKAFAMWYIMARIAGWNGVLNN